MAAAATPATELGGGPGSATYGPGLPAVTDYSILVVVGALRPAGLQERVLLQVDAGVRCWAVDLDVSVLDQQLKLFVSRHSAFLSEQVPGQQTLRHSGDVLDTQVVLSPSLDLVCSEVQQLISSPSTHKLLILAGQFVEDSGDLVLQKGRFSPNHLLQIFREEEAKASRCGTLTLSCPDLGLWRDSGVRAELHHSAPLHINPPPFFPAMEGLQEFAEYLSESLEPDSPFLLLEPPSTVGFLKLSRPCCYIFPAGRGDAAFFAVNGFNLLVNGGSDPRSCFWKLVRHLDRIDSVLLTHVGVDNLPGLNSLLLRKHAEQQLSAEDEQAKQLVSPEVGVVFLNAPDSLVLVEEEPSVLRCCDELALLLRNLQSLEIQPHSLSAAPGPGIQPIILFQKMGVGRLEMYVLHPLRGSTNLDTFMQTWPNVSRSSSELPLTCLASICALLVWHPFNPQEKIVRVLFPGCTPQPNLLEGLQKVSKLPFFKHPVVCVKDLETSGSEKQARKAESHESIQIQDKELRAGRVQRDELDPKKKHGKAKPKGTSETAPKEKKDGIEKTKLKNNDAISKLMKPVRKAIPKKDGVKEDKDEKACAAVEVKKEDAGDKKQDAPGPKLKRDAKPELKKDGRKEVKPDANKSKNAGSKDPKKAAAAAAVGSRAGVKTLSLKRDAPLPKRVGAAGAAGAAGTKSQKEASSLRRTGPQAPHLEPQLSTEASRSSSVGRSRDQVDVGGAPSNSISGSDVRGDSASSRDHQVVQKSTDLVPDVVPDVDPDSASNPEAGAAPFPEGGGSESSTGTHALHLNGHLCPESQASLTASCNGVSVSAHVHQLSELGSAAPHDVDLCLVSPCEFHHPKTPESQQQHAGPAAPAGPSSTPPSEGPCRAECPSGQLQQAASGPDSDLLLSTDQRSDASLSPPPSDQPVHPGVQLSLDPLPAPIKDLPPLPAQPGACMADADNKNIKTSAPKSRRASGPALKVGSGGRSKVGGSTGSSSVGVQASSRAPAAPSSDDGSAEVYVDLAYLPSGPAASTVDAEFFRRLRSLHYIISGDDEAKAAAMSSILDALLEGKSSWPEVQVTLIPTFDSLPMHDWYQDAHERLGELGITVLGSNSTVVMQEETFPACKVEF